MELRGNLLQGGCRTLKKLCMLLQNNCVEIRGCRLDADVVLDGESGNNGGEQACLIYMSQLTGVHVSCIDVITYKD